MRPAPSHLFVTAGYKGDLGDPGVDGRPGVPGK